MLSGIDGTNGSFLADLNSIQNRISQDTQQLSSGIRVSQASDDPGAIRAHSGLSESDRSSHASADQSDLGQERRIYRRRSASKRFEHIEPARIDCGGGSELHHVGQQPRRVGTAGPGT